MEVRPRLLVVFLISSTLLSSGRVVNIDEQIFVRDLSRQDYFGSDVTINEKYGVIGSLGDNQYRGSTYIFTYSSGIWTQQAKLTASDGRASDYFGISVSNGDEIVAVGALGHDINGFTDVGAVYIYESYSATWSQQAKIVSPFLVGYDYFGMSVRVASHTLVAGAFGENAAYVFMRAAPAMWTQEAKLLASDGTGDDYFGAVVDIDSTANLIVVSAFGDDGRRGSVYIFERSLINQKWSQMTKIVAANRSPSDFGISMRLHLDTLVVGAYRDQSYGQNQGSVYIFEKFAGFWTQTTQLRGSDLSKDDAMGGAVAIHGDLILTNAADDDRGVDSGSVYVFSKGSNSRWSEQMKILASDGMPNDYFGLSLAVHERQSLIAAPYRNSSAGGVYQFNIPFSPTFSPTISAMPTTSPTVYPTNPTFSPTFLPSKQPSFTPTCIPTSPTYAPSRRPTCSPSLFPTTRTSSPTERVVLSNKSDNSNQDAVHSVVFIVFLSIVGVVSLLSLICCLCNHRSRSNDDGNIQMTSVVSVAPAGPQFPSDSRFGSNPVASAVLVPYSSSPTHPQPVPLVVPNVVNDHQSVVTSADIQLPVAIVIP